MARKPTKMTNHVEARVVLHRGLLSIAKPAMRTGSRRLASSPKKRHLRRCLRCGRCPLSTGRCQAATLGTPERLLGPPTGPTPRERRRSPPPRPAPKAGLQLFRQRNYSPSTSRLPTLSSPHYGHGALIAASILPTAHPLTLIRPSA